jgi:hypothetical protein
LAADNLEALNLEVAKLKLNENEMETGPEASGEVSQQDVAAVVASLEPDQLASAKARSHCPRRQLTRAEMFLFWTLRLYLIFTLGVVVYQIWTVAR